MRKVPIIALMLLSAIQVNAQIPRPPESIRIPVMPFDERLSDNAIKLNEKALPTDLLLGGFKVSVGETTLNEVLQKFKTGTPLYNGSGYYQCYSLPRYSYQIWFVTKGTSLDNKINEVVVRMGDALPTEYCPLITSEIYPKFNNNIRLGANPEILLPLLGKPLNENRTTNVYLFQLLQFEKLKVQVQRGKKGIEMVKVTKQNF